MIKDLADRLTQTLSKFQRSLKIDSEVIQEMLDELGKTLKSADVPIHLIQKMQKNLSNQLLCEDFEKNEHGSVFIPQRGRSQVIMFVGLQGAGKTTTIAKYAYYQNKRRFKVGVVCADTFRAGAFDQLRMNCTRVNVPHYGSFTETDPIITARKGCDLFRSQGYELILVDTSGRHRQEESLFEEMIEMKSVIRPDHIVYVMDSTIGQSAYDQAKAFKTAMNSHDSSRCKMSVIVTKLDDNSGRGGGALAAVCATGSPITFIGTGEHFHNFEPFDPETMASRLLGLKNVTTRKLLEDSYHATSKKERKESRKAMIRMMDGSFTLRDLHVQISSVLKLGIPLDDLGEYIFGKNSYNGLMSLDNELESNLEVFFRRSLVIMDSMTCEELEDPNFGRFVEDEARIQRLALGSGCCAGNVKMLFRKYRELKKMFGGKKNKNKLQKMLMMMKDGRVGGNNLNMNRLMRMCHQMKMMGGIRKNMRRKR